MANDTRAAQQEAMASDASATDTVEDGKIRKSPYFNAFSMALALIDYTPSAVEGKPDETPAGLLQQWENDEPAGQIRDAVTEVLSHLRDKLVSLRDEPREETAGGKWYVGITADGGRKGFKSATVPNAKQSQCAAFKRVVGPFHTEGGVANRVRKGVAADDPTVFHVNAATLGNR